MTEWTDKNFGLVIAYLLPGFVALWGVGCFSPTVASWISASPQGAPTVAGVCYVTLASLAAGLIANRGCGSAAVLAGGDRASAGQWAEYCPVLLRRGAGSSIVSRLETAIASPVWNRANLSEASPGSRGDCE